MKLYAYQENLVNDLRSKLKTCKKVLIYAPTGAGKTIIGKYVISKVINKGKRVLFTTPRIKLATQTQKSFGFGNLILGKKTKDNNSLCTIASLQSIYSRKIKDKFDFIFIDECHYAHGSKYMNYIFDTYPNAYIIGLSATPIDENGYLLQGYDDIVNKVSVKDLIELNYLCDVDVYTSLIQPKTETISVANGDYNMTEASKVVSETPILSNALTEWQKHAKKLKTLVFACDIEHAEKLKKEFQKIGIESDCVHSKMKQIDIDYNYSKFNKRLIQVLINVDMVTFGFDEPSIKCLLFVRPIKSLRLYIQMVGRGLRTFQGKKKCLILDCANVIHDNGYPTDPIVFHKKPIINKTVDKLINIEREVSGEIKPETISKDRFEYLSKIASLVDLYANKVYNKEQELVDDCKRILKRGGFLMWRQNSGKMYAHGSYVHFTDKNGLPDITLIYHSVYIGLELKLPRGRLTSFQRETLPEFTEHKVCFFIIENIIDLFNALETITSNIIEVKNNIVINKKLYKLDKTQKKYRLKYKI